MGKLTKDEEIAMMIVTFCKIGDCQTFFVTDAHAGPAAPRVTTSLEFCAPGRQMYMVPNDFLRCKAVHNQLKKGLFKEDRERYLEAYNIAYSYIKEQGYTT